MLLFKFIVSRIYNTNSPNENYIPLREQILVIQYQSSQQFKYLNFWKSFQVRAKIIALELFVFF